MNTINRFENFPFDQLSPLARWLADTISPQYGNSAYGHLAVALTCHAFAEGHTCLDLSRVGETWGAETLPRADAWLEELLRIGIVEPFFDTETPTKPLQYDESNGIVLLALTRHAERDRRVAEKPLALAGDSATTNEWCDFTDDAFLTDEQKRAAAWAVAHSLTVISGGPGTGKTTIVARIAARLHRANPDVRIVATAPSGKAAARLNESFAAQFERLRRDGVAADDFRSPEAMTIHRLLGASADGRQRFVRSSDNPILADVVIVDEASMVSVELMDALLAALPRGVKLVLLGDVNQLKSVDPGNVLGAICRAENPSLARCVHALTESRRFPKTSVVGKLAAAILSRDARRAVAAFAPDSATRAVLLENGVAKNAAEIFDLFAAFHLAQTPEAALAAIAETRILCAQNIGTFGVEALNALCADFLATHYDNANAPAPIMVTANDYDLALYNGDTGVLMRDTGTGRMTAYFPGAAPEQGARAFAVESLPAHVPAYAITVHKSQGSEYSRMAIVLPDYASRILTRSLLYTAVTRFRYADNCRFVLCASPRIVEHALGNEPEYDSLLLRALGN